MEEEEKEEEMVGGWRGGVGLLEEEGKEKEK